MDLIIGGNGEPARELYICYADKTFKSQTLIGFVGKLHNGRMSDTIEMHQVALPTPDGGVGLSFIGVLVGEGAILDGCGKLFKLDKDSPMYKKYYQVTSNLTMPGRIKL